MSIRLSFTKVLQLGFGSYPLSRNINKTFVWVTFCIDPRIRWVGCFVTVPLGMGLRIGWVYYFASVLFEMSPRVRWCVLQGFLFRWVLDGSWVEIRGNVGKGFGVYRSNDFINWSTEGQIFLLQLNYRHNHHESSSQTSTLSFSTSSSSSCSSSFIMNH